MGAAEVTALPHALHMKDIRQNPANCPMLTRQKLRRFTHSAPIGVKSYRRFCKPLGNSLSFLPEIKSLHCGWGLWSCG